MWFRVPKLKVKAPEPVPESDPKWVISGEAMSCGDGYERMFGEMVNDMALLHAQERGSKHVRRDGRVSNTDYIELEDVQYAGTKLTTLVKEGLSERSS